jgi:hypothetical protein
MKLSKLIKKLEEIKERDGDLDVIIEHWYDDGNSAEDLPIESVTSIMDHETDNDGVFIGEQLHYVAIANINYEKR